MIFQLVYTCALNANVNCAKLNEIAQESHALYAGKDVTGLSLCKNGSALHILEGEKETLESLFEDMVRGEYTINNLALLRRKVPEREFKTWSMGFKNTENTDATFILNTKSFSNAIPQNLSSDLKTVIKTFERVTGLLS